MTGQERLFDSPEAPKAKIERLPDPIWDALTEHFGPARTKDERGRRNAAVRQLKDAEVTPEEIRITIAYCAKNFRSFTEVAICGWISRAVHEEQSVASRSNVRALFERMERGE